VVGDAEELFGGQGLGFVWWAIGWLRHRDEEESVV